MSTAWFYFKGDQRIGPVGSFKLKDLTTNGNILPADLVWKEGMASPQPASTVKGLFEASIIPPPPLPVREKLVAPQQSTEDEQGHVTPSSFTAAAAPAKQAGLVDNLKSAGTWAIKQADLARTKNVSLPAALHSLGKSICDGDYGRVALAAEYDVVDELRKQIAAIADCAKSATPSEGLSQQAKAMASATANAAQTKMLQVRLAQAIGRLGSAAYEHRAAIEAPHQLLEGVEEVHRQICVLEAALQELAAKNPVATLLDNSVVQILLIPVFGVGLYLILRSPHWSNRGKRLCAYGFIGISVVGAFVAYLLPERNKLLSDAERVAAISRKQSEQQAKATQDIIDGRSPAPPKGAAERPLKVKVGTVGAENNLATSGLNHSLSSVECVATEDSIVIEFDMDTACAYLHTPIPLLVRLFDKNGQYLTRFTTVEKFTGVREHAGRIPNAVLLKPEGNRLVYEVNIRDLRDASIVEIGFYPDWLHH